MDMLALSCFALSLTALAVQTGSCALAAIRCRHAKAVGLPMERPGISIVRPLRGLEHHSRETLGSSFNIDYPAYEIIFCVAAEDDPVLPLVRSLAAAHPGRDARILIGQDALGENPKLNNMAKGFRAARFDHVVFVDSNVLMPPEYLDQLVMALEAGAGMVSAPPVGQAPQGFWADVECAFLNTYQARMQYSVDSLGFGFAQGKTLYFRRGDLENGGLAKLADEPAEDAAATKMMRTLGRRIRLAGPFAQLIGPRTARQVWDRQVRWAKLRRASFPLFFAPEILAGGIPPLLALGIGLASIGSASVSAMLIFGAAWYLPELLLQRVARWPKSFAAILLRDLMLPLIFIAGCAGSSFEWHGRPMTVAAHAKPRPPVTRTHPRLAWARFLNRRPFA